MDSEYRKRLGRLRKFCEKCSSDAVVIMDLKGSGDYPSLKYFSGYAGAGFLVMDRGRCVLFVPKMELAAARVTGIEAQVWDANDPVEAICLLLKDRTGVLLDFSGISASVYLKMKKILRGARIQNCSPFIQELRSVKSSREIILMKKSAKIASQILTAMMSRFKEFKTEADVVAFLAYETHKHGCSFAFPPIVASGVHSALPHYRPSGSTLLKGFCVIDFGVQYRGYCSDISRTVFIGSPTKRDKEIYNRVLGAQEAAIDTCHEGVCASDLLSCARAALGNLQEKFIHGLGHGVGLEVHEMPSLHGKYILQRGMVITIEPGVYIQGKGGVRIEDDLYVGKRRSVVLSTVTKSFTVIPR